MHPYTFHDRIVLADIGFQVFAQHFYTVDTHLIFSARQAIEVVGKIMSILTLNHVSIVALQGVQACAVKAISVVVQNIIFRTLYHIA